MIYIYIIIIIYIDVYQLYNYIYINICICIYISPFSLIVPQLLKYPSSSISSSREARGLGVALAFGGDPIGDHR